MDEPTNHMDMESIESLNIALEKYAGTLIFVSHDREFVSSLAGGKTANVLLAGLKPGAIGIYEVHLELNSDLPTNPPTSGK